MAVVAALPVGREDSITLVASLPGAGGTVGGAGGRAHLGYARSLGAQHEALNLSAGMRVRGSYDIPAVSHRNQHWKASCKRSGR